METIEDVKQAVRELDPKLDESDDSFKTAMILLAATVVGAYANRVKKFTDLPLRFVTIRARRLRENGVWRNGVTHCKWMDEESGVCAFWMDVGVAEGLLQRA